LFRRGAYAKQANIVKIRRPLIPEARMIIESWRRFYNTHWPHGSLDYKAPAPEVFIPATARAAAKSQLASPPTLAPKPSMH
jgi:putative transposase